MSECTATNASQSFFCEASGCQLQRYLLGSERPDRGRGARSCHRGRSLCPGSALASLEGPPRLAALRTRCCWGGRISTGSPSVGPQPGKTGRTCRGSHSESHHRVDLMDPCLSSSCDCSRRRPLCGRLTSSERLLGEARVGASLAGQRAQDAFPPACEVSVHLLWGPHALELEHSTLQAPCTPSCARQHAQARTAKFGLQ